MIQSPLLVKGTVSFALVFSLLGAYFLWVAGSDFYDWYFTGNIYVPAKYSDGQYTSYSGLPGLFMAAVLKNLIILAAGIACIVAACIAPSHFRKREQARLAAKEAQPPPAPWPRHPKMPS
jgi:hypothetical protein